MEEVGERTGIEIAETLPGESGPRPLTSGDRAGEYEIVRRLGAGAMGEVYEGRHPIIGKRVAIKVIKQVLAASEESAQRFVREAKAVNQINHPNVVDVFAFGRLADGRLYLVMDLLEGQSLEEHLRLRGSLSTDQFLDIMEPICRAVACAHEAGVVHRDLKPANVFIADVEGEEKPKVVVLDFGVAKLMSSAQEQTGMTLTGQGAWIGTPVYMAPEQWTEEGASPRSDIYALGALGYELLSGSSPFVADSIPGVMQKHFHLEIPSIRETGKTLPRHIDDALRQAMEKNPKDRFATATELWEALAGARAHRVRSSRSASDSGKRKAVVPAVMGATLALAAAGALYALKAKSDDRPETTPAAQTEDQPDTARAVVDSLPAGAMVKRDDQVLGTAPIDIPCDGEEQFEVEVSKPGYVSATIDVSAGVSRRVELAPINGFVGVWKIPTGELRRFERDPSRDQVVAYRLAQLGESGTLYRFFEFVEDPVEGGGGVVFEASADHVDPKHPNTPSCRFPLAAQYRYDPGTNTMTTRSEEADVRVVGGECVVGSRRWSDFVPVLAASGVTSHTARSHAGAATPLTKDGVPSPNLDEAAQFKNALPKLNPVAKKKPKVDPKLAEKRRRARELAARKKNRPPLVKKPRPRPASNAKLPPAQNLAPEPQVKGEAAQRATPPQQQKVTKQPK